MALTENLNTFFEGSHMVFEPTATSFKLFLVPTAGGGARHQRLSPAALERAGWVVQFVAAGDDSVPQNDESGGVKFGMAPRGGGHGTETTTMIKRWTMTKGCAQVVGAARGASMVVVGVG
jgi:hypothetical protein